MMRKWMFIWALLSLFLIPAALGEDITALSVEPEPQEVAFDLTDTTPEPIISKASAEPISLSDTDITVDNIPNQTFTGEAVMAATIQTIVRIDPPRETEYVFTVKPQNVLDKLPSQLTGEIQGLLEDAQIDVIWFCEDYDEREEGVFLFTAVCDPEKYIYDETKVTMPTMTVTVGGEFELSDNADGTKTIEKWNRPGETLVIPAKIDGKAVTAVREGAFTEAATLTSVTLTDTIRSVPANAFGELVRPTTVKLIVTGDTRMESGDSFYQWLTHKETVSLPWAVTDFDVRTGGSLSLECDIIISANHQMDVEKGALVILNEDHDLTNNGAIINEGTMIFEGMLLNHGALLNVDQGTVSKELFFEPKSASYSISKDYDDKQTQYLDAADFRIVNLEAGESINISEVEADYGSAKAGEYDAVAITFSVQYVLTPVGYTYGELENITCLGTIKPKSITSNNNITIADISDQTWTGKAITPKVTVRDKDLSNRILTEGKQSDTGNDYYLTYEKNTDAGTNTAKVIVHGVNNYTGTKEKTFTIKKDKETKYVKIRLKGEKPHKIYDSTVNLNWKEKVNGETIEHMYVFSEWFTIDGLESGDTFSLETFRGQYDSADAGTNHTITFTFTPKSTQSSYNKYNYVLRDSDKTLKVTGCTIEPKVLTITPAPATKVYGANDPYITPRSASGMMEVDRQKYVAGTLKLEGSLSRESGEDAGAYLITPGTLKLGDNYTIAVAEAYMTITSKDIAEPDVTVTIDNQKYTGSAVTPDLTVEYGTRTLSKGKDYEVSFSNNIEPGLATASLKGIGNYTGEKTTQFRILKTSIYPVPEDTPLDEAHFPDSAFRKHLSEYYDADGDAILSSEEIGVISSLDVSNLSISSLKGIEAFCDLTWLYCSDNILTELDVTGCPMLRGVLCSGNALTSLDISQNPLLDTLYCDYNTLKTLDVSKNPKLTCLQCSFNQLQSIDVSENKNLIWLFCASNPLTTLDVTHNPSLVMINCCLTHLTALDISQNEKLEDLLVSSCRLRALDVTHNPVLHRLDVSENALSALDIRQCSALTAFISEEFHREEDGKVFYGLFFDTTDTWISNGVCYDAGVSLNTGDVEPGAVLVLPEGLTAIENEAFMGISARVVVLPNSCHSIGSRAFANCKNLRVIVHDDNPYYVAEDAFEGCDNLLYDLRGE